MSKKSKQFSHLLFETLIKPGLSNRADGYIGTPSKEVTRKASSTENKFHTKPRPVHGVKLLRAVVVKGQPSETVRQVILALRRNGIDVDVNKPITIPANKRVGLKLWRLIDFLCTQGWAWTFELS